MYREHIGIYVADRMYPGVFCSGETGNDAGISSGKSERRQAGLCDTCNLFYDCMPDVSGNESDCHSFVCTSGKSGDRSVAAKICIKLPNGIMLADLFWRSICKKLIYMGEKSDSS